MNQITTGTLEEAYKRISKVCKDLNIDLNEFIEWYRNKNKNKRKVTIDYSKGIPCNQKCESCLAYLKNYKCPWSKKDGM